MPFSPDEFKAKNSIDMAMPCNFMMRIPTNRLSKEYGELEYLSFLCNQTVLPGRHFSTNEYTTHGPIQRRPYQSIYDQLEVSIFCRHDLLERKFFDHWQNSIQSDKDYMWNYFKDYVAELELWYFTRTIPAEMLRQEQDVNTPLSDTDSLGMISHKVKFIDAFPLQVQPLALDWGNKDAILNLPVTFSYTKWQAIPTKYDVTGTEGGTLDHGGPTVSQMLGWASDTIDLIDMYTGAVPAWVKQGQQISGIGRSASGVINQGRNLFGPFK